ncbi:unnamed protein product, partial [Chrysoparadoxa australica]
TGRGLVKLNRIIIFYLSCLNLPLSLLPEPPIAAHGTKGETLALSGEMSMAHAMSLPVSQLFKVMQEKRERQEGRGLPPKARQSAFHIHFGAGKLGLGLVIPAIQGEESRFCVLQRPSAAW